MYKIFLARDHTIIRQGSKRIIEENPDYRIVGQQLTMVYRSFTFVIYLNLIP